MEIFWRVKIWSGCGWNFGYALFVGYFVGNSINKKLFVAWMLTQLDISISWSTSKKSTKVATCAVKNGLWRVHGGKKRTWHYSTRMGKWPYIFSYFSQVLILLKYHIQFWKITRQRYFTKQVRVLVDLTDYLIHLNSTKKSTSAKS